MEVKARPILFFSTDYTSVRELEMPWRMPSSGMLRRVDLVRTDVSEERSSSNIKGTRIGELGTALAITSNRRSQRASPWWWRRYVPPKRRLLQEPHGVTSQKTAFFISLLLNFVMWSVLYLQTVTLFNYQKLWFNISWEHFERLVLKFCVIFTDSGNHFFFFQWEADYRTKNKWRFPIKYTRMKPRGYRVISHSYSA
jgi:hypothetical protein